MQKNKVLWDRLMVQLAYNFRLPWSSTATTTVINNTTWTTVTFATTSPDFWWVDISISISLFIFFSQIRSFLLNAFCRFVKRVRKMFCSCRFDLRKFELCHLKFSNFECFRSKIHFLLDWSIRIRFSQLLWRRHPPRHVQRGLPQHLLERHTRRITRSHLSQTIQQPFCG